MLAITAALPTAITRAIVANPSPTYNISLVYSLGGDLNLASDLNDLGQMVGSSTFSGQEGSPHAILFSNGQLTNLQPLINDNNYSTANAINNAGIVVGSASPGSTNTPLAYAYNSQTGVTTSLGTLGGTYLGGFSAADDINNSGTIVGSSYVSNTTFQEHAFIYDPSTQSMSDIGTLDSDQVSAARAINDQGLVAGVSVATVGGSNQRSFLYDPSSSSMTNVSAQVGSALTNLGLSGASHQLLNDSPGSLNDSSVVGIATVGTPGDLANAINYAYVYSTVTGQASILGNSIGGFSTTANSINSNSQIVGASYDGSANHAYIYNSSTGLMTDLNTVANVPTGFVLSDARSINNNGQILVTGTAGTTTESFILSPNTISSAPVTGDIDGNPVVVTVNGGSSTPGGVSATFNISSGIFSAYYTPQSISSLISTSGPLDFNVPSTDSSIQSWYLLFQGNLNDYYIPVSFTYDPSLLPAGTDPSDLRIYHYEHGQWILPDNEIVDTLNHTISFQSEGFSPFALGLANLPEPTCLSFLAFGAIACFRRRTH
ncbi:MAG TPA: DUF3466 family protein [Tepidisphaeraceae bacterium]|nr:DUF3466 family protein [Tepidisphaeraceae bacterium]